ncbi:MAG: sodium:solute symporter family protein [Terriglobia bacterium]
MNSIFLILVAYVSCLAVLGIFLSSRVKDPSAYYVASRQLPAFLLAATLLAANIGAGSTVGATGLGYQSGLSAWWWVGSAGIGSLLLGLVVGPKLWEVASSRQLYTIGDYLEYRYSRTLRIVTAILITVGGLSILSGQFLAMAWILSATLGIPNWLGCLLGGVVVATYASVGGLYAAVWINLIQVTVKIAGFSLAVFYTIGNLGSWHNLQNSIQNSVPGNGLPTDYFLWWGGGFPQVFSFLVLIAPSFIVSPGILQKVYGAQSRVAVRKGVLLNAAGLLLFAAFPPLLGMAARALMPELPHRELALPMLLLHGMPAWIGAITLAAIFSAELGAADAVLTMISSSFVNDILRTGCGWAVSDRRFLFWTRLTSLGTGVLGVFLAMKIPSVLSGLTFFYSLLTVALLSPIVAGLYWARVRAHGALCSMAVGITATLFVQQRTAGAGFGVLSPVAVGVCCSAITLVTVTWLESSVRDTR